MEKMQDRQTNIHLRLPLGLDPVARVGEAECVQGEEVCQVCPLFPPLSLLLFSLEKRKRSRTATESQPNRRNGTYAGQPNPAPSSSARSSPRPGHPSRRHRPSTLSPRARRKKRRRAKTRRTARRGRANRISRGRTPVVWLWTD